MSRRALCRIVAHRHFWNLLGALASLLPAFLTHGELRAESGGEHWVAAWATSVQPPNRGSVGLAATGFEGRTLRIDLAAGDRRRASPAEDLQHLRQFHASSGQRPDRRQGLGGGYLGRRRAPRHLRRRELHPYSGRRERPQRSHSACCQGRGRSGGRSLPTGIDRSADLASGGEPDVLHLAARKLCG